MLIFRAFNASKCTQIGRCHCFIALAGKYGAIATTILHTPPPTLHTPSSHSHQLELELNLAAASYHIIT